MKNRMIQAGSAARSNGVVDGRPITFCGEAKRPVPILPDGRDGRWAYTIPNFVLHPGRAAPFTLAAAVSSVSPLFS